MDFWDNNQLMGKWRIWKNIDCRNNIHLKNKVEELKKMAEQRKILVSKGQDQLRWGNNQEGTFNLKESKGILLELNPQVLDKIWQKFWRYQGWMKIKIFMWSVYDRKILTWDNIRKRGVLGPSRCLLCGEQEETMEHLLNNCYFTSWLWDIFTKIFQQSDRDRGSIFNTLIRWRGNFLDHEIINSAWTLTPSFIIWNVWKDRNKRIFKEEKNPPYLPFETILKQLKETVGPSVCKHHNNPPSALENNILKQQGMQDIIPQGFNRKVIVRDREQDFWHPPQDGYLKFNIDGAAKGNQGLAGYGGILRDAKGSIIYIFHWHLGTATNNMAELMVLEQCLDILSQDNCCNVIVEADSELVINSVKRINNGSMPEKVSKHWKLIRVFQRI